MYLTITPEILLEDFLGIKYRNAVTVGLSLAADLSTRQIQTYLKRKSFPPAISRKLEYQFREQGFNLPDEIYDQRYETPISWKMFLESIQKKEDDFLPRTYHLIYEFADKDISFIKQIQPLSLDDRFSAYRRYLADEIVPLYCLEPSSVGDLVQKSRNDKEIKKPLYRIFLESVLHLLSFAESEYMGLYSSDHESILSKVIPARGADGAIDSPSSIFFQKWMKSLQLAPDEFVQEMVDHFGEAGISDDEGGGNNSDAISKEGLEKSLSQYLKKGKYPSWARVDRFGKGLHARAMEVQGRKDSHVDYCLQLKDIYGGVRIMDKLYHAACEIISEAEVLKIISTYPTRYAMHKAG